MGKVKLFPSDVLFSKYIRTRDNWTCQRCGKKYDPPTSALHCSHFWSRGNWSVRFDEDNCEALCYGCHSYLGGNPVLHMEHKIAKLGQKRFDALRDRKNEHLKSGQKKYLLSNDFRKEIRLMLDNLIIKKSEDEYDND